MDTDKSSQLFNRAVDVLFIKNPTGTALGILLGIFISSIFNAIPSLLPFYFDKEFIKDWKFTIGLCSFGMLIFNIKPYFDRKKVPQDIINALELIRKTEAYGDITKGQAAFQYRNLINTVVKNVEFNNKEHTNITKLDTDE